MNPDPQCDSGEPCPHCGAEIKDNRSRAARHAEPGAGSGSTLAAAEAGGYKSVGVELDPAYLEVAKTAIPALARFEPPGVNEAQLALLEDMQSWNWAEMGAHVPDGDDHG